MEPSPDESTKTEFHVSLAEIARIIIMKYEKLCDIKQTALSQLFRYQHEVKSSSRKSTGVKSVSPKFPSKNIRIAVQGVHEFDQIRLKKNCYPDSEKIEDSSSDDENSSLSSDEKDTYSSNDSDYTDDSNDSDEKSIVNDTFSEMSTDLLLFETYLSTEKYEKTDVNIQENKDTPAITQTSKDRLETNEKDKMGAKSTEKNEERPKTTEKNEGRLKRTRRDDERLKSTKKNEERLKTAEKNEDRLKSMQENAERLKTTEKNEERLKNTGKNEGRLKSTGKNEETPKTTKTIKSTRRNNEILKKTEKNEERLKTTWKNEETPKTTEKNEGRLKGRRRNNEILKSTEKNEETTKSTQKNEERLNPIEKNGERLECTEKNEERPKNTEKSGETLESIEKNEDTLITVIYESLQPPSNQVLKSGAKKEHSKLRTCPRSAFDEERYTGWKLFLENESRVIADPYQMFFVVIEKIAENAPVEQVLEMSLRKTFEQKTIDRDTIVVVDVQSPDVEKARQIVIDYLQKYSTTCIVEDQISVGRFQHDVSNVLSSVINKRLKRDFQELKTMLEAVANDDLTSRYMIREVKYNLGISDPESEDDASFEDLSAKILKLPHVFGVDASEGILQIYTVSDEEKQTEDIASLLKGNKYENAYSIMLFKTRPRVLKIEQGSPLHNTFGGTLGCFLQDDEGNVYALTAAHIFQIANEEVRVEDDTVLGDFVFELSGLRAIERGMDFGLIKIKPELKENLRRRLKDDKHKRQRKSMIMQKPDDINVSCGVYKYGYKTRLRFGTLSSLHCKLENGPLFYTVEDVDESDNKRFAEKGDSGSVICQYNQKENIVIAISLLTHCATRQPEDQGQKPKRVYYSIPLKHIVNELKSRTGKSFRLFD